MKPLTVPILAIAVLVSIDARALAMDVVGTVQDLMVTARADRRLFMAYVSGVIEGYIIAIRPEPNELTACPPPATKGKDELERLRGVTDAIERHLERKLAARPRQGKGLLEIMESQSLLHRPAGPFVIEALIVRYPCVADP